MSRFISLFLFFTFAGSSIASATDLYKTYSWAIQQSVKKETSSPLHVKKVIDSAHSLLGIPYLWGGMSREKGFDCSGMLVYLFKNEANIHLPRTTSAMLNADLQKVARHQLKPGDAVFFRTQGGTRSNHVGLYIGDNRFIHAPRTGKTIRIDSMDNSYWKKNYTTARRF
ncbi:C40 family peptidase [Pseudomonas sp. RL_5y_Pfl2_69]|uniref:C40 family peptidase n=1 Tax=Pseudomonas sp. RL_5y_Pfl2_69 TaxID=3088711 RepID=UPI00403F807F